MLAVQLVFGCGRILLSLNPCPQQQEFGLGRKPQITVQKPILKIMVVVMVMGVSRTGAVNFRNKHRVGKSGLGLGVG